MMRWHSCKERRLYRGWLYYGKRHRSANIEVSWGGSSCRLAFGLDDENGAEFSIAAPGIALFLSAGFPNVRNSREFRISVHDWAVWWSIWRDPMGGWSCDVPRWREGSFHPIDTALGRAKCTTRDLEERDVTVPMPEGPYPAKAKLVEYTWKRPRWFTSKTIKRVQIDIEKGIPHAGKGENSWDCGDDATFGITTGECSSIPEGIGILVGSVLRSRVRYGGWSDYVWSRPEATRTVNGP